MFQQRFQTASSLLDIYGLAFQKFSILILPIIPQDPGEMPQGCSFSRASESSRTPTSAQGLLTEGLLHDSWPQGS